MINNPEPNIGVIILTFNEEIHIERCINNVKEIASQIILIDSYSTDRTVEIATDMGAIVFQNEWKNSHAKQLNWGLENAPFTTEWILRVDADEILSNSLLEEIRNDLPLLSDSITGVILPLYTKFMGKVITRGTGELRILRLFRRNKAVCEDKIMDEHMILLDGEAISFKNHMIDHNLKDLTWWTSKHNNYSIREMSIFFANEFNLRTSNKNFGELSGEAKMKRKMKSQYDNMPLFLRAGFYFIYRYFFKGGFLEGREGFLWHFLQGFWYRILIDAKIFEIRKYCGNDENKIKKYILDHYQIKL